MNYCPKCNVTIRGSKSVCPLCEGKLQTPGTSGNVAGSEINIMSIPSSLDDSPAFPVFEKSGVSGFTFIRIITFLFAATEIVFAMLLSLMPFENSWMIIVMFSALAAWVDILLAMYLRNNMLKFITAESYVILILLYVIDRRIGFHAWSIEWAIPIALAVLLLIIFAIAHGAHLSADAYVQYIALNTVVSLTQLIAIFNGHNGFRLPAVICMSTHLVVLAGVVIFRWRELMSALSRRFTI